MMPPHYRMRFELHAQTKRFTYRVARAKARIEKWAEVAQRPYVAFSGGKDSLVALSLVRTVCGEAVPAVYLDADCSFPEVWETIKATRNMINHKTDEPLLQTLSEFGLGSGAALDRKTMQTTVWGPIKRLISEHGFDGVALGLRAEESRGRRMNAMVRGAVYQYKRDDVWACQPVYDWSYNDIWAYIVMENLPYCGVYDKMWDMPEREQRVSYWAGETNRERGRFAWLKKNYPQLFNRLVDAIPEAGGYV